MNSKTEICNKKEEFVNVVTHAPGVVFGVIAILVLLTKEHQSFSPEIIFSYLIYGVSFISVFMASSLYHKTSPGPKKQILKKIDHATIYFFMGGCYTPFIMINMDPTYRYWFLGLVWTIVITGVAFKFLSKYKNNYFSVGLYLSFAFMCFIAKGPLLDRMPSTSFWLLAYGGIAYVSGTFFYLYNKLPYNHGIWHIFVLIGAACHFAAIYLIN
jgi:hemolysin III